MIHSDDRPVVVFGNLQSASLARYCLDNDSNFKVIAYTVDSNYMVSPVHEGLPMVEFETLEEHFSPSDVRLIIPMGYQLINGARRQRFENAKARGYDFISYVSSRASIWPDLKINANVLIYEHAIIQPFAAIGDNCIIRSGAHISHHCRVNAHSFVAAEVAMGGDCNIGEQSFLGVGSVYRDRISLAPRTFIGAGAVVTQDTDEDCVYVGNPARKMNKSSTEAS